VFAPVAVAPHEQPAPELAVDIAGAGLHSQFRADKYADIGFLVDPKDGTGGVNEAPHRLLFASGSNTRISIGNFRCRMSAVPGLAGSLDELQAATLGVAQ
jgi:hypothetical protein